MKAILVIDMPSRCFNCPVHQTLDAEEGEHEFAVFCNAEHWREPITHIPVENLEERPNWCPLIALPSKQKVKDSILPESIQGFNEGWNYGWNACLEAIIGETK